MLRLLLICLFTIPTFAQLPGVTQLDFPRSPQRDPVTLVFTSDGALWAGSAFYGILDRFDPEGITSDFPVPFWGAVSSVAEGPDGALWITTRDYIAKRDHATGVFTRWENYTNAQFVQKGSDGNLWFVQHPLLPHQLFAPRVIRLSPAGVELSSFSLTGWVTSSAFGSDGALWLLRGSGDARALVRIDAFGSSRELPVGPAAPVPPWLGGARTDLFPGPGFLWVSTATAILRISTDGMTLGTYVTSMTPAGVDAAGNLWLRERREAGEEVGRLEPNGRLTRFGPLPLLPSGQCPHTQPVAGGFAVAPDGRVAMADYYPIPVYILADPCSSQSFEDARATLTVLDPLVAPVLSIELTSTTVRRRGARS